MKQIHKEFYKKQQGDVTRIIPALKRNVLSNCHIFFAPDVLHRHIRDPTHSGIWHMAASFGATCSTDLTGKTTHFITLKWDAKTKAAKEYGHAKIVTPAWLLDSTARWKKQNEEAYSLQDAELSDIENPDSVSLEDHLFDEKEEELVENVDWDEVNKELEDFMDESEADNTTDSESVTHTVPVKDDSPTDSLHRKWKRKRAVNEEEEEEEEDRIKKKGKSSVTILSNEEDHDLSMNSETGNNQGNDDDNEVDSYDDDDDDDDDLDSLAGILEEELLDL